MAGFNLSFGGDDNEYVNAASRAAAESTGPSIIASLLDAVGIGRQVAKGPKKSKGDATSQEPQAAADLAATESIAPPMNPSMLDDAIRPRTPWGNDLLTQITPMTTVDPDIDIFNSNFDQAFKSRR